MNRKNHDVEKQRYWQRTIGDAARSGMSIREFCRQRRLIRISQGVQEETLRAVLAAMESGNK